ncbi:MAG: efflux RND transporter periplasmic adaptor subunit [Acidobacteria bacterium]|nr:efflux RND transporter periplasmic adaptor subunit [Acidobacteriota bacterium]
MPATNPLLEPLPAPKPPQAPPRSSVLPKLLGLAAVVVVVAAVAYYLASGRQQQAQKSVVAQARTATAKLGTIESRLRVTGATAARSFANITAPRLRGPEGNQAMVLLKLASSGQMVKKGDVIAEFDPQSMKDHQDDTIAGLRDKENDVKKKIVQNELDMENLQQTLRVAKANLDKANLDFKAADIRTEIDRELLKLAVDEADATYKELLTDLPREKESQSADLRITEIAKVMEDKHVERHEDDLKRLVLHSPMDGMVVLQTTFRSGGDQVMLSVGDRVGPGQPIMKVIDSASMQVEGQINQAETSTFRIGMPANIGLDAFPGARFDGKVYAMGALAVSPGRQQYYIRNIPVRVQIVNPDKRVIPDLSASADVLLGRQENVVTVPAAAVRQADGKDQVEVKTQNGFEKRTVKVGLSNGAQVAILEGLREGETVRVD